jgi:outer membrane protein
MNFRTLLVTGAAAGALALASTVGAAPAPAAASAAAAPIRQGPPIGGYCVFSLNEVIGGSKVGQAVVARLKVLGSQVNAELQPEADAIRRDDQALQAAPNDPAAASKRAALEQRFAAFQRKEQQRQQEMQATQQKQFGVVLKELDPIIRELYQQRNCSVLIDGDQGGVRLINPAMNISPQAITGLDARIQTLTFDREHLDTQAPGAAPAR